MKEKILKLLKSIVLASLLTFGLYIISLNVILIVFYSDDHGEARNQFPVYCCLTVIYGLAYHLVHNRKNKEYLETNIDFNSKFDLWGNIKEYFIDEGKYLLAVYAAMLLVCEISILVLPWTISKFICAVLISMAFPFFVWIEIPIVRSIGSILIVFLTTLVFRELQHYRIYRKFRKGND